MFWQALKNLQKIIQLEIKILVFRVQYNFMLTCTVYFKILILILIGPVTYMRVNKNKYSSPPVTQLCTFEQDICQYTQDTTDNFEWTRKRGATATPGTGPLVDHTLGSRQGMNMENM